jgi:hypothetical protein
MSFDKPDGEAEGFIVALEVRDSEQMYLSSKICDVSVFASHPRFRQSSPDSGLARLQPYWSSGNSTACSCTAAGCAPQGCPNWDSAHKRSPITRRHVVGAMRNKDLGTHGIGKRSAAWTVQCEVLPERNGMHQQ